MKGPRLELDCRAPERESSSIISTDARVSHFEHATSAKFLYLGGEDRRSFVRGDGEA